MRNKVLRSVLVAALSVMATAGVWSGYSEAKGDVRANTTWPSVVADAVTTGDTNGQISMTDGAGS
jgi:hypothetical protein